MQESELAIITDADEFERNLLWLAIDRVGHIGRFQSFGEGVLPASFKASVTDADYIDEFIDSDLKAWRGSCDGIIPLQNVPLMWFSKVSSRKFDRNRINYLAGARAAASQGIYDYDATSLKPSGYTQIAYPSVPKSVEELPQAVQKIVRRTTFKDILFADAFTLSVQLVREISE